MTMGAQIFEISPVARLRHGIDDFKQTVLIQTVREFLRMELAEEDERRISRITFEGMSDQELYFWDFGKMGERFLMAWNSQMISNKPVIEVKARIPLPDDTPDNCELIWFTLSL